MDTLQSLPETRQMKRILGTVGVTLLAGAATAFVALHHLPTQAGGMLLAQAPGFAPETGVAHVDL